MPSIIVKNIRDWEAKLFYGKKPIMFPCIALLTLSESKEPTSFVYVDEAIELLKHASVAGKLNDADLDNIVRLAQRGENLEATS